MRVPWDSKYEYNIFRRLGHFLPHHLTKQNYLNLNDDIRKVNNYDVSKRSFNNGEQQNVPPGIPRVG